MILNSIGTALYFLVLTIPIAIIPIICILILRHRYDDNKCSPYWQKREGLYVYGLTAIVCVICTTAAWVILNS